MLTSAASSEEEAGLFDLEMYRQDLQTFFDFMRQAVESAIHVGLQLEFSSFCLIFAAQASGGDRALPLIGCHVHAIS